MSPHDASEIEPDSEQIAIFLDVVLGDCEGFVPLRSFGEKGQGCDNSPHNSWPAADVSLCENTLTFARYAARQRMACYVVPGTVAESGDAKSSNVIQLQSLLVDLDTGDIDEKLSHLMKYLGEPTLIVESGGRTTDELAKLHIYYRLAEPAGGDDIKLVCDLRAQLALKVGGDRSFGSAHQPIRIAGSVYFKSGNERLVKIREHHPHVEVNLRDFAELVDAMPVMEGIDAEPEAAKQKPSIQQVLTTPVREGSHDAWTRFEGASAVIGHHVRLAHEGRVSRDEAWEAICQYNAAMLDPPWPLERLHKEMQRIWWRHEERHGPPLERREKSPISELPTRKLSEFLDDTSPMPEDLISPRVLTPGGMLVLGGAPKVGKSDFLINLLLHMAAGVPFLGFAPRRPMRIFYLQAEIQYHYLLRTIAEHTARPASSRRCTRQPHCNSENPDAARRARRQTRHRGDPEALR